MRRQLIERRVRLDAGARPIGWKVGFGSDAAMAQLGISQPLVGWLTDASVVESGSTQSVSEWTKPLFEPEVAVHMAADLRGGATREEVVAAIAGVGPAIELIDVDPPPGDIEDVCAGNIYHRSVVLGPARPGASVDDAVVRVLVDGEEVATTNDPEALPGGLIALVGHVAQVLDELEERLHAGDVVITGAIVPPLEIRPGSSFHYELTPFGQLSLTFR
jgi:2-keto-4-pentenoate hydratase